MTSGIQRTLTDPAASDWLKDALRASLSRDAADAANDAEALAVLLAEHALMVSRSDAQQALLVFQN